MSDPEVHVLSISEMPCVTHSDVVNDPGLTHGGVSVTATKPLSKEETIKEMDRAMAEHFIGTMQTVIHDLRGGGTLMQRHRSKCLTRGSFTPHSKLS